LSYLLSHIRMISNDSPRAIRRTLLCIGHMRHDIVHLHRVAERAEVSMGLQPHFLITAPTGLKDEPRQYLASHHLCEAEFASADYSSLGIRNPIKRYRTYRQANLNLARLILDTLQPAGVLATVDACHDLLVAEATRRGIPTIYMQVALWGDRSFYRELWADDQQATQATVGRPTLRQQVRARIDRVVQRGYGLHNRPAWWRESSRIAVLGPYWEEILTRGGIPTQRIAVTGNPHCDQIHEIKSGRNGRWGELYEQLRLPHGTRYLLHCREHQARQKSLPATVLQAGQRQIIDVLQEVCPGIPVVVKMHPRDTHEDHKFLRSIDARVIVAGDVPMIELLAQSLLMVTTTSTTQLWSTALDRPTISAFFWKGMGYWERATTFSGVERVFTPEQLRASVSRHMNDSAYQSLWRGKRQSFVNQMLVVDGHSIDRLVRLLQDPFYDQHESH